MFASILLAAVGLYLLAGVVFLCAFQTRGLRVVDPASVTRATPLFRIFISPGVIALWPLLALRWRAAKSGPSGAHA